jgi:hypothetical protein
MLSQTWPDSQRLVESLQSNIPLQRITSSTNTLPLSNIRTFVSRCKASVFILIPFIKSSQEDKRRQPSFDWPGPHPRNPCPQSAFARRVVIAKLKRRGFKDSFRAKANATNATWLSPRPLRNLLATHHRHIIHHADQLNRVRICINLAVTVATAFVLSSQHSSTQLHLLPTYTGP